MSYKRQDLRDYGDNELTSIVMNDEGLYNMRHESFLYEVLDDYYIYSSEQYNDLQETLEEELEEEN